MKKATNASLMKIKNQKLVLSIINKSKCSRADIARSTGLTKAAVTLIVDELINDGYVEEYISDYNGVGRKPINLKLRENSAFAFGVNITRKHYEVGIVDLNGNILKNKQFDIDKPSKVIDQIQKTITEQINETGVSQDKILGIGITTPGPVNYKENTILTPPNFNEWHNLKLDFQDSIHLENISDAAALSEKYFGCCKDIDNYIMLMVDEGIGSGLIIDNKIYRGNNGRGTEAGHISINFQGIKCECGNVGCLEKYASVPAILEGTGYIEWKQVIENNDIGIIKKEAEYLSCAMTSIINLFDISTVLISGDIGYKGKLLAEEINNILYSSTITKGYINVLPTKRQNGVLIAASPVIDDFFQERG